MSDKGKNTDSIERSSDEIVEETMKEIYDEIKNSDLKEENFNYDKDEEALEELQKELQKGENEDSVEELEEETAEDLYEELEEETEEDPKDWMDYDSGILSFDESDFRDAVENEEELDEEESELADEEDDFENDPRLVRHRRKKLIIRIVLIIIGVLLLAYLGVALFFNSHFYFFTKINGTEFSAKTVEQVEKYMENQVADYELTLKEIDGDTEVIDGTSIDLEYVKGDELEQLLKEQNPLLWITALWDHPDITAPVGVEFDEDKLTDVLNNLKCMDPEEQVKSESARPVFQDTEFVIQPEVIGSEINTEKFTEAVTTAIGGFVDSLDMKEADCYILPAFTSESEEVSAAKDKMNSYLGAHITYDFSPYTEVVDSSVISQWVTVDDSMNVTFNQDSVRAYIQDLASKYDTYGKTRTITTGSGNTAKVEGGSYGWQIDQEAEYAALTANIENAETVTREPEYARRAASHEGNDFGTSYVEIDLTNQHVWVFVNGQCVVETACVTGNPNKGNGTPQGTYSIAYKQQNTTLRGPKKEDGTYEWESPVSYWMPFNGGIGLHDASWQSTFGGDWYLTGGSHGCVNLPPSVAPTVYANIEAGTPVVCHY